jgi:hypothetical protein
MLCFRTERETRLVVISMPLVAASCGLREVDRLASHRISRESRWRAGLDLQQRRISETGGMSPTAR